MYGFPQALRTRADYEHMHALALAGEVSRAEMARRWRGLLATRQHYVFDRVLGPGEQPDGPEPDYVVRDSEGADGAAERHQFRLMDNPQAPLYVLGYSEHDVMARINELEGA